MMATTSPETRKDMFIQAIHDRRKIRVRFFSEQDNAVLTRLCAPMDFGPGKKIREKNDRYWVWDYESDTGVHPLGLRPERIEDMVILDDQFDPAEFVTWETAWIVDRDWGRYS